MKLIVGLGNPGRSYDGTRHNIGFEVVNALADRHDAEWGAAPRGIEAVVAKAAVGVAGIILAKPLTFMNLSGAAVAGLVQFYKIGVEDLLVVVDDVHLELKRLRTRVTGSAGGHNGLKSISESLGTQDFSRLRVGVGRGDARRDLADHVLGRFERAERENLDEAIGRAADAAELFLAEGIGPVMNRYNRKEDAE